MTTTASMGKNDPMVSSSISTTSSSASNCNSSNSGQYNAGFISYLQAPNVYINNQKVEQTHYPAQHQFAMQTKIDSHSPTVGQPGYHPQLHPQSVHQMPIPTFPNPTTTIQFTTTPVLNNNNINSNNNAMVVDSQAFTKSSLPLPIYYIRNST